MADLLSTAAGAAAPAATPKEKKGERRDLFDWIDAIWNKSQPAGRPPVTERGAFLAHAFLAADPDGARLARELQHEVRDAEMIFKIWQGYMPRGARCPRWVEYVKLKKPPAAEKAILKVMAVYAVRREVAEQMYDIVQRAGRLKALHADLGMKPKEEA